MNENRSDDLLDLAAALDHDTQWTGPDSDGALCRWAADEIEQLRSVVNSALGYKASMMQTISSRPRDEQDIVMQGRLILRQEFISACERYEAAEAAGGD